MTTETQETDWVEDIGQPAYESIAEMVAALEVDYDRMEELRDDSLTGDEAAELAELKEDAGECENEDDARQRIDEDPLSVEVRSGWHSPGDTGDAEEFRLLLGTGGPAVQIIGELTDGEPSSACLQVQDWFKPWTEYIPADQDVLLKYCRCFYLGD